MKTGNYRVVIAILLLLVILPVTSYFFLRSGVKARDLRSVRPFSYENTEGDTVYSLFTDQRGDTLQNEDFIGKIYVASFLFSQCDGFTYCDSIPYYFHILQDSFGNHPDFQLLTYTINPDVDSAPLLEEWAQQWNADPDVWHFVRGDRYATHQIILGEYFGKIKYAEGNQKYMQPDEKVVLVGPDGMIKGYYSLYNTHDLKKLTKGIRREMNRKNEKEDE